MTVGEFIFNLPGIGKNQAAQIISLLGSNGDLEIEINAPVQPSYSPTLACQSARVILIGQKPVLMLSTATDPDAGSNAL